MKFFRSRPGSKAARVAAVLVLAAGSLGAGDAQRVVPVSTLLPVQSLRTIPREPIAKGSARETILRSAGVDVFSPLAAEQFRSLWSQARAPRPIAVTHRPLIVSHPEDAAGRLRDLAFVQSHAAIFIRGGRTAGANSLGAARLAQLGIHPSFAGATAHLQNAASSASEAPHAGGTSTGTIAKVKYGQAVPAIASVSVNGVVDGSLTGASDDTILISGTGLTSNIGVDGSFEDPTQVRADFGDCGHGPFYLDVQAVDPEGTWVLASAGASSKILVNRRVKTGTVLVFTHAGHSDFHPLRYRAQLEITSYTELVMSFGNDAKYGIFSGWVDPLNLQNQQFAPNRYGVDGTTPGVGQDIIGNHDQLINDAVYIGAAAIASDVILVDDTKMNNGHIFDGRVQVNAAAAVATLPNGYDLYTQVDWSYSPGGAIQYTLTLYFEAPVGVRPLASIPPYNLDWACHGESRP